MHAWVANHFGRPCLHSVFEVGDRVGNLEKDTIGSKLSLVWGSVVISRIVVVVDQGEKGSVELFAILEPIILVSPLSDTSDKM